MLSHIESLHGRASDPVRAWREDASFAEHPLFLSGARAAVPILSDFSAGPNRDRLRRLRAIRLTSRIRFGTIASA